jgi:RimJ/RimL family protein N-acetyltransferase
MTYFLQDSVVGLRHLEENDISGPYANWLNNQQVNLNNSHGRFPVSSRKLLDYIYSTSDMSNTLVLAVIDLEKSLHIGNISLQSISWIDRSAEIAFILGDSSYSGKGFMFRAGTLLISHAFNTLNLNRIACGTLATNIAMIRLASKLGMTQEGRRRQALFKNNQYIDILEYGLVRSEWHP